MIYNKLKFLFLLISIVLLSCRTTPHSTRDTVPSVVYKADEIVFEYHDASVPPDDHRSYVITLNPDKLIYVVDSYGELIKRDSINIEPNKWNEVRAAFASCDIRNVEKRKIQKDVQVEVEIAFTCTPMMKKYLVVTNTDAVHFLTAI